MLLENSVMYPSIQVGNIYAAGNVLVNITEIQYNSDDEIGDKKQYTSYGNVNYYHDGYSLKYKISTDGGISWEYEEEDGHWVELGWINTLISKGSWTLVMDALNIEDIFNNLNESYYRTTELYFQPPIEKRDWSIIVEALLNTHPNIMWGNGDNVINGTYQDYPFNILIIDGNNLSWHNTINLEGIKKDIKNTVNGWEYLGLTDATKIFDSLYEAKLVNDELTPEVGDELIYKGGDRFKNSFTAGRKYTVFEMSTHMVGNDEVPVVHIKTDNGNVIRFTTQPLGGVSYKTFFDLDPTDIDVTSQMFDTIYEGYWDLNENIQIDYNDLREQPVIGLEFFNPKEYSDVGIVYTIIDSDDRGIDVQWFDNIDGHGDNNHYDTIYWDEFIRDLNRGFWKLKTEFSDFNPFDFLGESKQDSFMNENYETPENYTPKVGDVLRCHTDLIMLDNGDVEAIQGKDYPIINILENSVIEINDESNSAHRFDIRETESSYHRWFHLIPKEVLDMDFFGEL